MTRRRYVVVGGGIVGLATAHRLLTERPGATVTVLEKESCWGAHQTRHNSGVIHAGVYYTPGSLKARLCRDGNASMIRFCRDHGIAVDVCGKLIVAASEAELPRLKALYQRAVANGLTVQLLDPAQAREYEPHVRCVAALHVASTAITDFGAVCDTLARLLQEAGARLWLRARAYRFVPRSHGLVVETTAGEVTADVLINCAGLHSDRVARLAGLRPPVKIIPFRGEYHQLVPARRYLVRNLIYPVPDPQFPFLGVHLTRMIDGSVHVGPNAVLALAREGYRWSTVRPGDLTDAVGYPGLWRLARRHLRYGAAEVRRSWSRRRFAASVARLVPAIEPADLQPAGSGVRAQAVRPDGTLVDDFLVVTAPGQVHVLNAPSPAATSALEIARYLVNLIPT